MSVCRHFFAVKFKQEKMKKLNSLVVLAIIAVSAIVTSCSSEDDGSGSGGEEPQDETTIVVSENITSATTWETGKTYVLTGRIAVESGTTLTIQPGVVIKGQAGTGANATALLIARGATLMAIGEANKPIIFTSIADEITPELVAAGSFASPNLEPTTNGLWGGLIVLGNAKISASSSSVQIEGIPSSDTNGLYGGDNDADSSGVIKYVSIRHGGANIGEGNEINGLTLGGVGSGTVIENVEIVGNQDDGIEWFGGKVNVTNAVVWNCGDDGIDTDQSWSGTLNNFAVLSVAGHAFELDGPEGSEDFGSHTIENGFIRMSSDLITTQDIINVDDNSNVNLKKLFFTNLVDGQKINRVNAANVTFTDVYLDTTTADLINRIPEGGTVPSGVMAGNSSTFNSTTLSWTWASNSGQF